MRRNTHEVSDQEAGRVFQSVDSLCQHVDEVFKDGQGHLARQLGR
jgi:hypothetical protein